MKLVLDILGLLPSCTYAEILQQLKYKTLKRAGVIEDYVLHSIEERTLAWKNKDFSKGDKIKADLASKGIQLMDTCMETIWS